MNDIEYLEARIEEQTAQLEEMKAQLQTDKETKEAFDIYSSFLRAGFEKEQAWEMFMELFKAALW